MISDSNHPDEKILPLITWQIKYCVARMELYDHDGFLRDAAQSARVQHIFYEQMQKHLDCRIIPLDIHLFAVLFSFQDTDNFLFQTRLTQYLEDIFSLLDAACSVTCHASIGRILTHPLDAVASFYDASCAASHISPAQPILFRDALPASIQSQPESSLIHIQEGKNFLVEQVKNYIHVHLQERLLLSDLAEYFHISPNYLSQLFKKHMGIVISEYISTQKIQASKKLLRQPGIKIYEVAEQFGFDSPFYYSKVFKRITGVSPTAFRNLP